MVYNPSGTCVMEESSLEVTEKIKIKDMLTIHAVVQRTLRFESPQKISEVHAQTLNAKNDYTILDKYTALPKRQGRLNITITKKTKKKLTVRTASLSLNSLKNGSLQDFTKLSPTDLLTAVTRVTLP